MLALSEHALNNPEIPLIVARSDAKRFLGTRWLEMAHLP
jgi:lipocalin